MLPSTFRNRAVLRSTTSLIVLAIASGTLHAQQADDVFLGTLVLGESKRKVRTDTAVAETDVDQREINDRQASTIAELIDSVPGVSLVNGSTPQGSGINIRGFGANSTYGADSKVAVQIDGASTGSERLYRIGTQLFTDPLLYKSVSVIRGTVGSFEYGSGIVGGVVKLETKDASDFTGGEIGFGGGQTLEFSSNGGGIASSTVLAWQPSENLEFLVNYTWRDQSNQKDGSGNTIGNSSFTLPSGLVKAKYTFGEARDQSLTLSYNRSKSSDRDVPYDSFGTTGGAFGNVDRDTDSKIAVLNYNYNPINNDLVNVDVVLSYADQKIDQRAVAGTTPVGGSIGALIYADHRYETTKLTVKNTSFFDTGVINHDLRTGLELMRRERRDAPSARALGGRNDRIAIFAVDDMRIGDAWTITPALRFETSKLKSAATNETSKKNALMGGLSVRYAFGNGLAVFGSAAYTEGLPIIDDLDALGMANQSEKSHTFEIGASFERSDLFNSGDNLAFKATAYKTKIWDVTSYVIGRAGPALSKIDTEGLEVEISYALESGLYMDLNANITDGSEYTSGVAPIGDWRLSPADSVRFTLGKRFGEKLDLSWEVVANAKVNKTVYNVNSGIVGTETEHSSAFGIHNLRATYIPQEGILEGTQIRFGVENVFDRDYTPHLSTRPAPGRNLKLTLSRQF